MTLCTHRYVETSEKKSRDGSIITKIEHYKCRSSATCEVCGHCADDCPGHQRQPGPKDAMQGYHFADSAIGTTAHLNATARTGNVRVES